MTRSTGGPMAWLTGMPHVFRVVRAMVSVLAFFVFALVLVPIQENLEGLPLRPYLGAATVCVLVGILSGLRGLFRPPPSLGLRILLSVSPVIPLFFSIAYSTPSSVDGPGWLTGAFPCLGIGLVVGSVGAAVGGAFLSVWPRTTWRIGALSCVAGMVGWAMLMLHCPSQTIGHLLMGHGTVGLLVGAVLLGLRRG